ncbi:transposase [Myxococcus sp. CA051A]|uniref:transposase n=1 Tax=unclassified Myxococcus TaxID=2648731 RepID=UPI00157A9E80|nr:transposase [Myxococcus sp. CA056]NTX52047.1 transposase [Myxococcus sp. CA039A]NTX66910.1 transposase [Myxococcus sp. CA051A]
MQAVEVPYTDAFKAQMVKRMVGPSAVNASTLARQVGVSQPTLSQWLRAANRVAAMAGLSRSHQKTASGSLGIQCRTSPSVLRQAPKGLLDAHVVRNVV